MPRLSQEEKQRRAMFANMRSGRRRGLPRASSRAQRRQLKKNPRAKNLPTQQRIKMVSRTTPPRPSTRKVKPFTETEVVKLGDKDEIRFETAGYTNKKERIHSVMITDAKGSRIQLIENEEAGKYTPKRTKTSIEYNEDIQALGVTKTNPRSKKVVSQTLIKIETPQPFLLKQEFEEWDNIKDPKEKTKSKKQGGSRLSVAELRVLAQDIDVPSAGVGQVTLEKRLRTTFKKAESTKKPDKQHPKAPENIVREGAGNVTLTESHKDYWKKVNTAKLDSKEKEQFFKDLKAFFTKQKFPNTLYSLKEIRPHLKEKGYSRFEQDAYMVQLAFRDRKIDLQSASHAGIVQSKKDLLIHPVLVHKGTGDPGTIDPQAINYVAIRR